MAATGRPGLRRKREPAAPFKVEPDHSNKKLANQRPTPAWHEIRRISGEHQVSPPRQIGEVWTRRSDRFTYTSADSRFQRSDLKTNLIGRQPEQPVGRSLVRPCPALTVLPQLNRRDSVFLLFTGGQAAPKVSLFPNFPRLYVGDEVTLRCKEGDNVLNSGVEWKKGGNALTNIVNGMFKLSAVTVSDSGTYTCKGGGGESSDFKIDVQNMVPLPTLSILNRPKTVLGKGDAVLMELYVEEGLDDWWCRYTEGDSEHWMGKERWENSGRSVVIHAEVKEEDRIFWCIHAKKGTKHWDRSRSNAIKLTATEKMVMLQLSQRPAWSGDNISLSCDVWGGAHVERAVFYKNGEPIKTPLKDPMVITNVVKANEGEYTCNATYKFTHISRSAAEHTVDSDRQTLTVIAGPPEPQLNCESLSCSCTACSSWTVKSYRMFYTPDGSTRTKIQEEKSSSITFQGHGRYACSVKQEKGQSRQSNWCIKAGHTPAPNLTVIVVVVLFVLGLLLLLLGLYKFKRNMDEKTRRDRKREDGADGGYEEVGTGKKEGEYELLNIEQDKDKSQYETLKGKGQGEGEGGYEALKAGEAKGDVYHTLKEKGQGEGGYEALKTAQAEVYHTLKDPAQGKGEYEALKDTQGKSEYETLKDAQGKGEYEALKSTQAEVYHSLGEKQESGKAEGQKEESPYEELKAEKKEKEPE
ncbi:hypothetical protein NFI96_015002 [Prochilodus magdalenae]|nr:hypothetical protein NFI96_015002 [Prochilodus magdalenae]